MAERAEANVRNPPIADIEPAGHIEGMAQKLGRMTLAEARAVLGSDPAFMAMRVAREKELAEIAEQRNREQQPLLEDLKAAGVTVGWVHELLSIPEPDQRIYAVLLEHLTKPYNPWLLEWIGRAFGRKAARPIMWDTLIRLIKTHALEKPAADGVMIAISDMAQPGDVATLIDLLSDTSLGRRRIYLVNNLMRSQKPEARAALTQHKDDPDLNEELTARLARSRG